jgi:hypothetical protein
MCVMNSYAKSLFKSLICKTANMSSGTKQSDDITHDCVEAHSLHNS